MTKTLFITIFQSFLARSILGTEAFRQIASTRNIKIIIFAPNFKKDFYAKHFGRENVIVEPINSDKLRALSGTIFQRIAILLLPTYFVRYHIKEKLENRQYFDYPFSVFVNYILAPLRFVSSIFRFFDHKCSDTSLFDHYFEKYKPNLVFAPDVFSPMDAMFLLSAKKAGVNSIGMVRSWDCTTNKNALRVIPAKLLANNEQIKKELIKFHNAEEENVVPVGFPQFDPYINWKPSPRKELFKQLGFDSDKRLILFAPGGSDLTDIDWQYCEILREAQEEGKIPSDLQFLVRQHPQDKTDLSKFKKTGNFFIDKPGLDLWTSRATEINATAVQHLIDSLYHSDLIITFSTSLGLDAVVFDKPHVMLAFDGYEKRPFLKSVRRYHQEDNMKGFIDTGAVRVVSSLAELAFWVNKYLERPEIDKDSREKARQEILFKTDGASGRRISEAVLRNLIKQ